MFSGSRIEKHVLSGVRMRNVKILLKSICSLAIQLNQ